MQTDQTVSACLAARAELERLERDLGELPPDVLCALGHLNLYLFDYDCEQTLKNMRELANWVCAPYEPGITPLP